MKNFEELGLSKSIVEALKSASITEPTEIQSRAIPLLVTEKTDFIALAQTGTGKTAAFGLPLLENFDDNIRGVQSMVIAPTRELAQQIAVQLEAFSQNERKLQVAVVFGGASIMDQIRDIKKRKPSVIIATPGRLKDLMKRKVITTESVNTVVLDEADEMLNMGFKEEIHEILGKIQSDHHHVWLFSATMAPEIRKITEEFMEDPKEVIIHKKAGTEGNKNIEHRYCITKQSTKAVALERFIDLNPDLYGIVFCRTKRDTKALADHLVAAGYMAEVLNGDLSQEQRDEAMSRFRRKVVNIMVATDVAARGIDVEDLTHVFHFNIPDEMAFYTHRSGRTGRAGKKGVSMVFASQSEKRKMDQYAKRLKIEFTHQAIPTHEEIAVFKVQHALEKLTDVTEPMHISDEFFGLATSYLSEYSQEQLIELILRRELLKLNDKKTEENLNVKERAGGRTERADRRDRRDNRRDGRRDRGERNDRRDRNEKKDRFGKDQKPRDKKPASDGMHRFFINVGKMDRVSKGELVEFISDTAGIKRKDIGSITIEQRHAFFEVNKENSRKIKPAFDGAYIDDRPLRVNRDD